MGNCITCKNSTIIRLRNCCIKLYCKQKHFSSLFSVVYHSYFLINGKQLPAFHSDLDLSNIVSIVLEFAVCVHLLHSLEKLRTVSEI